MANYEVKDGLYYTENHEWIRKESDQEVSIGVSDYAAREMDELVYAEATVYEDDEIAKGDVVASLESVKAASDVYTPVSGTVLDSNEEIEDDASVISEDPYGTWLVKVELSDPSELEDCLEAKDYRKFIEEK